jgi:uncharacterized protein (DUF305 family)
VALALLGAGVVIGRAMGGAGPEQADTRAVTVRLDEKSRLLPGAHAHHGDHVHESEAEFLAHMIPHHQEAIDSARVLRAGTERPEMRAFADEIIATQQREVDQMTGWLERWHEGVEPDASYEPMMRKDLEQLRGDELDRAFLEDMLAHHMMAVHSSQSSLVGDLFEHQEVAQLAEQIRDAQQREIVQMLGWLREWFDVRLSHDDIMRSMAGHH